MERTIAEHTAIALQAHAEWLSACSRTGHEMLLAGTNYTEPRSHLWLAKNQDDHAELYDLARYWQARAAEVSL